VNREKCRDLQVCVEASSVESPARTCRSSKRGAHSIIIPWSIEEIADKVVVLSSGEDDDFCRCIQVSFTLEEKVLQMKCIDDDKATSTSKFFSSDYDDSSQTSGNTSSSEYVQNEFQSETETTDELPVKQVCGRRLTRSTYLQRQRQIEGPSNSVSTSLNADHILLKF